MHVAVAAAVRTPHRVPTRTCADFWCAGVRARTSRATVIHWGTTSGVYSNARDVGEGEQDGSGVASFELELPALAERNYFALTSYDEERRMSAFSNELSALVP